MVRALSATKVFLYSLQPALYHRKHLESTQINDHSQNIWLSVPIFPFCLDLADLGLKDILIVAVFLALYLARLHGFSRSARVQEQSIRGMSPCQEVK